MTVSDESVSHRRRSSISISLWWRGARTDGANDEWDISRVWYIFLISRTNNTEIWSEYRQLNSRHLAGKTEPDRDLHEDQCSFIPSYDRCLGLQGITHHWHAVSQLMINQSREKLINSHIFYFKNKTPSFSLHFEVISPYETPITCGMHCKSFHTPVAVWYSQLSPNLSAVFLVPTDGVYSLMFSKTPEGFTEQLQLC